MLRTKRSLVVCLLSLGGLTMLSSTAARAEDDDQGAVFVMTNAASNNQIDAFVRNEDGTLTPAGQFATDGNGSGGTIDPLHSQGSLLLSNTHRFLFAVNAGSNTVSTFAVHGARLTLVDTQTSGGTFPSALAQSGDLLYVLNSGGTGNVSGFRITPTGHLHPIPGSSRDLSGSATRPTSLAFSPNGFFLAVAESATNNIDIFRVDRNGRLSDAVVNPSAGTVPFAALFAPDGALLVGNASNSISSYQLHWDGSLSVISDQVPTLGVATCWNVVTPNGRFVYTANAGTSNLSGFEIHGAGLLSPIDNTIVASNASGSTNLDTAISADGRFVYTLNAGAGTVGVFEVDHDGDLHSIATVDGLAAKAGFNGIAAY